MDLLTKVKYTLSILQIDILEVHRRGGWVQNVLLDRENKPEKGEVM